MEASHTIGNAGASRHSLDAALSARLPLELDASRVKHADLTFVQLVVSAAKSFEACRLPFSILRASKPASAAFARAGVVLPAHLNPFEGEGAGHGDDTHGR